MNLKWTFEKCKKEAKKYNTKFDFITKSHGAYIASWRNNWLGEFTWLKRKTYESDKNKKNYYVYSYELNTINKVYVGITNNINRRDRQHRFGNKSKNKIEYSNLYFTAKENNIILPQPIILYKELTPSEAQIKEHDCIEEYKLNGWILINKAKTGYCIGSVGTPWIKWDKEKCYKEALKYTKRSDFSKSSNGAYESARKNGWLDDYTWFKKSHITHKKGYWTYDTCYQEALKFKTKKEFEKESGTAAKKAWENKWMDDYFWFEEKQKPRNYWNYETCENASKKCANRTEFCKKYYRAYEISLKNKWIDLFFCNKNNNNRHGRD